MEDRQESISNMSKAILRSFNEYCIVNSHCNWCGARIQYCGDKHREHCVVLDAEKVKR